MSLAIPPNTVLSVASADLVLEDRPHSFETGNAAAIRQSWRCEIERNPALFDGETVLFSHVAYAAGVVTGTCHPVRYATLRHYLRRGGYGAWHLFPVAILVAADNALIAIRMAAHTAHAGQVYFASGSLEPFDFFEARADVEFNMQREVAEETGIDLSGLGRDPHLGLLRTDAGISLVRRYYLKESAPVATSRIAGFLASQRLPEAAEAVVIRSVGDLPTAAAPHMAPLVRWHFGSGAASQTENRR